MTTGALPLVPVAAPGHNFVSRYLREISVLAAYLLLLLALLIFRPRYFEDQFASSWIDAAPMLIAAVGMTLVILARHIDISVGSQFSACAITAALLAKSGMPMP